MSTYAIIIDVDGPPVMVAYEGFAGLKKAIGCDMAEVAGRFMVSDIQVLMLVDEEGLLKGLLGDKPKHNELASVFRAHLSTSIFWPEPLVGNAALVKDDGEDLQGFSEDEAREVMKFLDALHDDECKECGFPSLDGVWYDGTCEDCHNEIMERSIYSALKGQEAGNETVQG
jgi:hypothetical protein